MVRPVLRRRIPRGLSGFHRMQSATGKRQCSRWRQGLATRIGYELRRIRWQKWQQWKHRMENSQHKEKLWTPGPARRPRPGRRARREEIAGNCPNQPGPVG